MTLADPKDDAAERKRAEVAGQTLAEQRKRLLEASHTLLSTLSLDEVIDRILRALGEVLSYDFAAVYWLDEARGLLTPRHVAGRYHISPDIDTWNAPLGRGITGAVASSGQGELVNDAHLDPRSVYPPGALVPIEHLISLPIRIQGKIVGVLNVARSSAGPFGVDQFELAQLFTSYASIAIEHARLFEQIAASETKYRRLFEESRDAVYICSRDGRFVDINPAGVELLGYDSREEVLALGVARDVYVNLADLARLRRALAQRDFVRDFSVVVRRKNGVYVDTIHTIAVERDADGEVVLYRGVARDVTEARRAEETLRAAERRSIQSDKLRALGQMAGGIAHNLNQSLGLVVGHGELALQDLARPNRNLDSVRDSLRAVVRAAMDGADTVKRLLAFSRADTDALAERIDLGALLEEVARLTAPRWRDAAQAEGRPISVSVESDGTVAIMGWAASLREAFANLVLNAVDALPRGGSIRLVARRQGDVVEAVVEDDGTGMSPKIQGRIFEPFFSTKDDRGTGLGLPIVFSIVERHAGQIAVDSKPGRGARFVLTFAAAPARETAPLPPAPTTSRRSMRILAVDDEPELRLMIAQMLERDGHSVVEAASGEEAILRLESEPFDLVVSDVGMGAGMNGWELADQVRARWPGTRFVMATGWGAQIDAAAAAARGVQAVVSKPYRISDLLRAIAPREH